ncbi:MAG: hypothetical protein FWD57_02680 [Polyangiaceae bacterium]|nr:hypothetical protein [Polyangiaceae bacterium]
MVGCIAIAPAVIAAGAPVDAASEEQTEKATMLYLEAKDAFDKQQMDKALQGFQASFDVVASPNSILMVARILLAMDRIEEAYTVYQEAERVSEYAASKNPAKYDQALKDARDEMNGVRNKIGIVTWSVVGASPQTQLSVNGKPIPQSSWSAEMPLRLGEATVVATEPGKPDYQEVITVTPGGATHSVNLAAFWAPAGPVQDAVIPVAEPKQKKPGFLGVPTRTWSYVAGGVGAAGLLTFTVAGVASNARYNELETHCKPNCSSDDVSAARRDKLIANAGLIVGIVGVGAGTALFLLSSEPKQEKSTAHVDIGPGSVMVRGTFR